jgi:uncharacterized protein (TIGR03086 family)
MSDPVELYRRVTGRFSALVDEIGDGDWDRATPCDGWTVRDLLEHVVARDRRLAAALIPAEATADGADAEPADLQAAWHERVAWWQAGLDDPQRRDQRVESPLGETTFADATCRLMTGELTIHTWDLARALGRDEQLDEEAVEVSFGFLRQMDPRLPRPGAFGTHVVPPDDADLQTEFLCFTGRQP